VKREADKAARRLQKLQEAVTAQIAALESEQTEHEYKIALLRAAELAAPRKRALYFLLARLILEDIGAEVVASWLPRLRPDGLRKIADAQEITEKAVDKGALKAVIALNAALAEKMRVDGIGFREAWNKLTTTEILKQYRGRPVPKRESLARMLRRLELWRGKPGRPRNPDKSG
jgi:hypothetical protein